MKQHWERVMLRLDALNLRERVLVFLGAALVVIFLLNMVLLEPAFRKQKVLSEKIKSEQASISRLQLEIQGKAQSQTLDPDKANQDRLKKLQEEMAALRGDLDGLQGNLVPPDKVALMLEDILKRHGRLRLISLRNLPRVSLNELDEKRAEGNAPKAAAGQAARGGESGAIYQHAVEIVVYGNYVDMQNYLAALESLRWQLYWSKARFQVDRYPNGTLSLTVYTLSLDKSWLNF